MRRKTSEFGIYFGTELINITEVGGGKALFNVSVPEIRIVNGESEQKIPNVAKITTALRNEFNQRDFSPNEVSINLAGEDFIIRTFDLPIFLSKRELKYGVVAFEAKKYIPFKIEQLVFDFRLYPDRKNKKNLVLFVGIKKEILDKYLFVFKELGMRVRLIEYAGFSILRLLKIGGLQYKGVLGLLNVDLEEETNFIVCQNGFPLFSRDIVLIPKSESQLTGGDVTSRKTTKISSTAKLIFMERLKSEIRISLDFFRRKFPTKPLDQIAVLSLPQLQPEISSLIKDLGLSPTHVEISKVLSKDLNFSCVLAKSYAVAMSNVQRLRFSVNLLKPAVKEEIVGELPQAFPITITAVRMNLKVVLLAFLMIISTFGWGWYKRAPLENELKQIMVKQPAIEGISAKQSLKAISSIEEVLINKVNSWEQVIKERFYLTIIMNIIPRIMPRGAWLGSISFQSAEGKLKLALEGIVFLGDSDKEFAAVNDIVLGFKNDPEFSSRFKAIEVVSIQRITPEALELEVTKFEILCRSQKK